MSVDKVVAGMRGNPKNVRYDDLHKVCEHHVGTPRTTGGSHAVFKDAMGGRPTGEYPERQGHGQALPGAAVLAAIDKKEAD